MNGPPANNTLIHLINDLLAWKNHAHEVLGDYLEECGFERRFHQQPALHTRRGVVAALLRIRAITPATLEFLDIPDDELEGLEFMAPSSHPQPPKRP